MVRREPRIRPILFSASAHAGKWRAPVAILSPTKRAAIIVFQQQRPS